MSLPVSELQRDNEASVRPPPPPPPPPLGPHLNSTRFNSITVSQTNLAAEFIPVTLEHHCGAMLAPFPKLNSGANTGGSSLNSPTLSRPPARSSSRELCDETFFFAFNTRQPFKCLWEKHGYREKWNGVSETIRGPSPFMGLLLSLSGLRSNFQRTDTLWMSESDWDFFFSSLDAPRTRDVTTPQPITALLLTVLVKQHHFFPLRHKNIKFYNRPFKERRWKEV